MGATKINSTQSPKGNSFSLVNIKPKLIQWLYNEQPDWKEIQSAIKQIQKRGHSIKILSVTTENDMKAIVVGTNDLTEKSAQKIYDDFEEKYSSLS